MCRSVAGERFLDNLTVVERDARILCETDRLVRDLKLRGLMR